MVVYDQKVLDGKSGGFGYLIMQRFRECKSSQNESSKEMD